MKETTFQDLKYLSSVEFTARNAVIQMTLVKAYSKSKFPAHTPILGTIWETKSILELAGTEE